MNQLKTISAWVGYTLIPNPAKGKPDKIPVNPHTLRGADTTNPQTWGSFEAANNCFGKKATIYRKETKTTVTGEVCGVGFVFPKEGSNLCGIDLDGIIGNPEREQQAQRIIAHMQTYTEYSPSGNGYHLLFRADISKIPRDIYKQRNDAVGIECYISGITGGRYFTYTGEAINTEWDIEDRTEQLLSFLDKYMRKENPPQPARATREQQNNKNASTSALNVSSIIEKARKAKNSNLFQALFDRGDTSAYNGDDSRADQALCNMLAFWTGGNPAMMDELFRQSALYRDKWLRKDYRTRTINEGIKQCNGKFYTPKTSRTKGQAEPSGEPGKDLIPGDFTDVGEALILAREYGERFKYSGATGYLTYNGSVWEDIQEKRHAVIQRLTNRQLREARQKEKAAKSQEDKDFADAYIKFIKSCRNNGKSNGVLSQVLPHILISVNELDADPFLLNTPAGTVDLTTGTIRPHNYADYCTKITSVSPGTKGSDIFMDALNVITQGNAELANYIQEYAGMAATGRVFGEYLGIAYGGGANGKSTLFNVLARVLGNYAGSIAAETLMANEKNAKTWDYAELRGKRLIIAAELEEGKRLSGKALKIIASTDMIHAERKYKDPFDFKPSHSAILYTNHLPKIGSSDAGTWRRLIVIPFNAKIEGNNDIKNYADYLFEHAGEAVLQWIIDGAKRFISNGCKIEHPQCVKEAIAKYQSDNDWLSAFLFDCCDTGKGLSQPAGELLTRYRKYCLDTGEFARGQSEFKNSLENAGYELRKEKASNKYYGLRIKPFQPSNEQIPADWGQP